MSPRLDYALYGMNNGGLKVIRTKDGKSVESTESALKSDSNKTPVVATQFSQKEKRLAILHADGTLRSCEFPTLLPLENLPKTLNGMIEVIGRSQNGRYLAAISDRTRVSVYDLETSEVYASWQLPKSERPTSISVDNLGKRIAIGFDAGSIAIFQIPKD